MTKEKKITKKDSKEFPVTEVTRLDLQSIGFDTKTLKDEDMKNIARLLSESFCEGNANFWQDLETIAIDVYGLKQHDI